ncbi:hypothetical protein [Rhodococcus sp. JS3073]|uniref:hypothetical protein n=1 Tax=Rhodococcus sp. JS3073 TaxID=3002901 RepID=UPI0022867D65|nr:hypothetical protein [Rhodococcus sp. JS3073]WAM19427.1 hypothetical protein OYT95_43940 [Rhodococcus sp. JS3073]
MVSHPYARRGDRDEFWRTQKQLERRKIESVAITPTAIQRQTFDVDTPRCRRSAIRSDTNAASRCVAERHQIGIVMAAGADRTVLDMLPPRP